MSRRTTATAGPISSQFVLDGAVVTPSTYDLATLSALTPTTQTVTYTAGGTPVTDTYTGTLLQTLVNAAGGFIAAPGVKKDERAQPIETVPFRARQRRAQKLLTNATPRAVRADDQGDFGVCRR